MKIVCMLIFAVFLTLAVAEDSSQQKNGGIDAKTAMVHETKSTAAYKKAKEACVKSSSGELKGKKLTECIVNYQKEAK